jgi:hypothetical protein
MPPPEVSHRTQWAVLWPATGYDDQGEVTVGDPVEIKVRWTIGRGETTDKLGNTIALDASAVVDRVIVAESNMWLGRLEDWYGSNGSAGDSTELMRVVTYSEVKDIRGNATFRTVGLKRYRDALPNHT